MTAISTLSPTFGGIGNLHLQQLSILITGAFLSKDFVSTSKLVQLFLMLLFQACLAKLTRTLLNFKDLLVLGQSILSFKRVFLCTRLKDGIIQQPLQLIHWVLFYPELQLYMELEYLFISISTLIQSIISQ